MGGVFFLFLVLLAREQEQERSKCCGDYACDSRSADTGLLILTDGYAPAPTLPDGMRCKIIWVCQDRQCYDAHHAWMEKLGRVCTMEIH